MTTAALDREAARALLERPKLRRVLAALQGDGEETRVVGGAVRDALLGRAVGDVDLATTALPAVTIARAKAAGFRPIPTGVAHGTVTVVVAGERFEVTTLREDVETDGRHAVVRFGRDFAADAARRDFTVNALSLDAAGALHDTTGGLPDLEAGRVRFIGEPRRRIREDFLRTLRFFRFHASHGRGPLDPDGFDAAIRERDGLARLSRERVRLELLKLVAAERAPETLGLLQESGLLQRLVGGIAETGRLGRAGAAGSEAVGRLAAALVRTAEDGERLKDALRLSRAEAARLIAYAGALSGFRSVEGEIDRAALRRLAAEHGVEAVTDALAAAEGELRPGLSEEARTLAGRYRTGAEPAPVFPLTGQDLLDRGASPGPALGLQLAEARRAWLAAGCPPDWASA